jgi:hypothetical protein
MKAKKTCRQCWEFSQEVPTLCGCTMNAKSTIDADCSYMPTTADAKACGFFIPKPHLVSPFAA